MDAGVTESRLMRPRGWPPASIDLLLKACLLPDERRAAEAWRAWIATHDFDAVTHPEMHVLAALSARIATLDPDSPYRPRMEGLARSQWTRTQLLLGGSIGAVARLAAAGIPTLIFKGAAQYAEGLATERRRIMGDLDLLVPRGQIGTAVTTLTDDGWAGAKGESAAYLRAVADVRVGMNLVKGRHGELDLHRTLFHFSRFDAEAEMRLWSTAADGTIQGHRVRVAAPEINVIVSLVHAIESPGGDWAIDVATRLRRQALDWDRLIDFVARWRVVMPVRIGLAYLADALEQPIPREAMTRLAGAPDSFADRLQFWSRTRMRERHQPIAKQLVRQATRRYLMARGYVGAVSDRTRVTMATLHRPAPSHSGGGGRAGDLPMATCAALPAVAAGRLTLSFETRRPQRRRRLCFDVMAGEALVAHVRTVVTPGADTARFSVAVNVPATAGQLTVVAWPLRRGEDAAAPDEAALPFRVAIVPARGISGVLGRTLGGAGGAAR
jgi:hypothetical protein